MKCAIISIAAESPLLIPLSHPSLRNGSRERFRFFYREVSAGVALPEENGMKKPAAANAVRGWLQRSMRYAISRAISIIWVNVFWRSSAGRASPVTALSEMVSSESAFFPAAAAFR